MLLSILASAFGIKIDRAIGAPGHGKDIVDGLNATDKVFSMVSGRDGDAKLSLATESARLCGDPARFSGVKSEGGKRQKREAAAKTQERHYHVQDPAGVKYTKTSREAVGFEKGEHNGLLAHYSLHVSKELGPGKAALRRIPCACVACLEQIELKWERGVEPSQQPRFASSKKCQWWSIFAPRELQSDGSWKMLEGAGLNDWKIISLEEKKGSDPSARSMRTPTATTWSCSPACPTRCRRTSS